MDIALPEELTLIRDTVREFVANELLPIETEVLAREAERGGARGAPIPRDKREHLRKLAVEQGLWAMTAPEPLGGGGLGTLGACLVAEELGKTFVDFDFGDIPPILFDANAEQREQFLKPAIAGEKEVALALREPGSIEIRTRATRDGEAWQLNGTKVADDAEIYLVFARAECGVTCFIVEGLGTRNGKIVLQNVRLPGANVLGEIGGAFALAKRYLDACWVRAAARKVGIAARLLTISAQYARDWKALGQPLAVRPAVQRHIAEMAMGIEAARWLVYRAACEIEDQKDARWKALRAHLFTAEMTQRTIDATINIFGGPAHAADLPMLRIYGAGDDVSDRILELQRFQVANELVSGGGA